jgi:hypothetical protein
MSRAHSHHHTGIELSLARNGATHGGVSTARDVMIVGEVEEMKV